MEHDGCNGCKYEHYSETSEQCSGCKQNAVDKYTRMTNADRIRAMTDEELALLIVENMECMKCPFIDNEEKCGTAPCNELFFDWLQEEVDE